jgi:hypothetical protein
VEEKVLINSVPMTYPLRRIVTASMGKKLIPCDKKLISEEEAEIVATAPWGR